MRRGVYLAIFARCAGAGPAEAVSSEADRHITQNEEGHGSILGNT
jgi:hypothetical protein